MISLSSNRKRCNGNVDDKESVREERGLAMSKKILILEGSPRKNGNTDLMAQEFAVGATEAGHKVEKIYIKDKTIKGCLGCGACQRNGGSCVQKDDMTEIYEKIAAADAVVFACPVYFYSWTSQIKTVIDRTFAIEPTLTDTKFYMLSAGAAPELKYMENMTKTFELYISCFRAGGVENAGVVYGLGANAPGDVKNTEAMTAAYELGKTV